MNNKEWNGEGLPPVGTVCNNPAYGDVEITYQGFGVGCAKCINQNVEFTFEQAFSTFTPIKPEWDGG